MSRAVYAGTFDPMTFGHLDVAARAAQVFDHLTLAVADLEEDEVHNADALYRNVTQSLETAISAGELSPRDQALVKEMWDTLYEKASHSA